MVAIDSLVEQSIAGGELGAEYALCAFDKDRPNRRSFIAEADREAEFASFAILMALKDVAVPIDAEIGVSWIEAPRRQLLHFGQQVSQEQFHRAIAFERSRTGHLLVAVGITL